MTKATQFRPCGACEGMCASSRECKFLDTPEPHNDEDFDDDHFEVCANCDLPDACYDFGCAIKSGIRKNNPEDGIF
jgi:hypothetical protein